MTSEISNALTVDVEDYFMASAFEPQVTKSDWSRLPSRVVQNTRKMMSILAESGVKGTFFVLGWVGEHFPELVREIRGQGHEIACHGYDHRLIYDQTPDDFRKDVRRSKEILEKASGAQVRGYRAPSFSITRQTEWALKILKEEGYLYDASLFPGPHARGGFSGAPLNPHRRQELSEFPMSVISVGNRRFGFSGGGYFRLFPYPLVRWGIRKCMGENRPAVVYLHPWEIDPGQPRFKLNAVGRFKHYVNLSGTEEKLKKLLLDFRFKPMEIILRDKGLM